MYRNWYLVFVFLTGAFFTYAEETDNYKHGDDFSRLVRRLSYNPDDLAAGDELREHCRANEIVPKCIESLNELTKKHPKNKSLRYQAALAYVDEVPGHSLFRQGWLSTRSMNHMTKIIEGEPDDWTAHYIRGLNGLYWPTSFRKLPGSIKDLTYCISLSDKLPRGLLRPYHGYAYIALGDAFVKKGEIDKAIKVYKEGVEIFTSAKLEKRLQMSADELAQYVADLRHTDTRVDTTISFLVNGGENKL